MKTPLRALMIEDNEIDAALIRETLDEGGYDLRLRQVETEEEMRAALRDGEWDIVLSDYNLPAFDAKGALRVLEESGRDIPAIIISGTVGEDVAVATLKLGASDYLLKQNLTRLVPAVARTLEDAENRRARSKVEHMKTLILENSLDLICTMDTEGRFLEVSSASRPLLGYEPGELAGLPVGKMIPPAESARFSSEFQAVLRGRRVQDLESRLIHKAGRILDVTWSLVFSKSDGVVVCVARDVTERKQKDEDLRVERDFSDAVLNGLPGVFYHFDVGGRFLRWNKNFEKVTGYTAGELAAMRPLEFFPDEDKELVAGKIARVYEVGEASVETSFLLKDGTRIPYLFTGVGFEQNGRKGFVGVGVDISGLKQMEQALRDALAQEKELSEQARAGDRAKSEFLAVMSHEVRTPLNGILGFAELMRKSPSLSPECQDYASVISQSGEALLRILDDILDFSRLEAGRLNIEKGSFCPRALLEDIRALLSRQASDTGVPLLASCADDIPEQLEGDAGRLRQVLLNLAGNALKFTEAGSVCIGLAPHAERPGAYVFSVIDTGCGIGPGEIERIFQPFTQADSSASRRHSGTGLGLTISRRLVELLGGSITVSSIVGKGSEFRVTVPLGTAQAPARPAAGHEAAIPLDDGFAGRHPLRLLIVEDDRVNLKLIQALVRRLGYSPLAAHNGREALEVFQRETPDFILMDLQMPEMDGAEATEKIRAIERGAEKGVRAYILALTANIFPADRQRCLDAGMDGYLNKPVKIRALAEAFALASANS